MPEPSSFGGITVSLNISRRDGLHTDFGPVMCACLNRDLEAYMQINDLVSNCIAHDVAILMESKHRHCASGAGPLAQKDGLTGSKTRRKC